MFRFIRVTCLCLCVLMGLSTFTGTMAVKAADSEASVYYAKASDSPVEAWKDKDSSCVYDDLQDAMDKAYATKGIVLVAVGTYKPTQTRLSPLCEEIFSHSITDRDNSFVIPDGVSVIGGFEGDEIGLKPTYNKEDAKKSVMDGQDVSYNVFLQSKQALYDFAYGVKYGGQGASLDNVTIQNGNASGTTGSLQWIKNGGGIFLDSVDMTISNCIFEDNSASGNGGALYYSQMQRPESGYQTAVISNCDFEDNDADIGKDAYHEFPSIPNNITYTGPKLMYENCSFNSDNRSMIYNNVKNGTASANPVFGFYSCEFNGASSLIYQYTGVSLFVNSVFRNTSTNRGGITTAYQGESLFSNCSFDNYNIDTSNGKVQLINSFLKIKNRTMFPLTAANSSINVTNCTLISEGSNFIINNSNIKNQNKVNFKNSLVNASYIPSSTNITAYDSILKDAVYDNSGSGTSTTFSWSEILDTEGKIKADGANADLAIDKGSDNDYDSAFRTIKTGIYGNAPQAFDKCDLAGNMRVTGGSIDLGAYESDSSPGKTLEPGAPLVIAFKSTPFNNSYLSGEKTNQNVIMNVSAGRMMTIPGAPGKFAESATVEYKSSKNPDYSPCPKSITSTEYDEYSFISVYKGQKSEDTTFITNIGKSKPTYSLNYIGGTKNSFKPEGTIKLDFNRPVGNHVSITEPGIQIGALSDLALPSVTPTAVTTAVGYHDSIVINENNCLNLQYGHTYKLVFSKLYDEYGNSVQPAEQTFTVRAGSEPPASSTFTVQFDTQGGSEIKNQNVSRNGTATQPEVPTREGYTFTGWYTDKECTKGYDFKTGVTQDLKLYAGWVEVQGWNPFTDVPTGIWYHDDVKYVWEKSIMDGVSSTLFGPDIKVNRGMMATVLWRMEGSPKVEATSQPAFTDLTSNWYKDSVAWAADKDIILGYSNGLFGPEDNITREQMSAMLYRYIQYKDGGFKGDWSYQLKFSDSNLITEYAYESVCYLTMEGIINGKLKNLFDPQGTASRAELSAVLHRVLDK